MPQQTMLKKSSELPFEPDFVSAFAKAIKNNGCYHCIINWEVYSFYINSDGLQDCLRQSLVGYDHMCSVASSLGETDPDILVSV